MSKKFENGLTLFAGLKRLLKLSQWSGWMALVALGIAAAPVRAEDVEMRVAIDQDADQSEVGGQTATQLIAGDTVVATIPGGQSVIATAEGGTIVINSAEGPIRVNGVVKVQPTDAGLVYIQNSGDSDRNDWYRGYAYLVPTGDNKLTSVNYVPLEQYLYSVVGREMFPNWNPEALKAQAVAARSYALYQRQTSANQIFDVGDTPRWQAYPGVESEANTTIAAVDATPGQVLAYSGQIIEAVFHASSGGCTENVEDVWSTPLAYLRAVRDPYDQNQPWQQTFTAQELSQRITGVGRIQRIVPERTTDCGRIISARVIGDAGERTMDGDDLRRALDLKSTLFQVSAPSNQVASLPTTADPNSTIPNTNPVVPTTPTTTPATFMISGRGFGHGLGMSQWGANGMAQQGYNYQQILTYYYTGANLAVIQVQ
jgi:stage II sporulation protein D